MFRDIYRVTPRHQYYFTPEGSAVSAAYIRAVKPSDPIPPSRKHEIAEDIHMRMAEGFALPGPIAVPDWLKPWL